MSKLEIIGALIGSAVIALVLWKILRNGTVSATLDVDPDDGRSSGA